MSPPVTVQETKEVYERCLSRYPTIAVSPERFAARLEDIVAAFHHDHGSEESGGLVSIACPDCASLFRQLHHEDLFLALGCALGDRIAWEHFADEYLPLLKEFARQACRNGEASEDLAQEIVIGLLGEAASAAGLRQPMATRAAGNSGDEAAPAGKLMSYNGRGSLSGWLRVSVAHAAIDRFRREKRQVSLDELTEQGSVPNPVQARGADGDDDRLDERWGPVLSRTLEKELANLSAHDRLLLSLYYLEGVTLKAIGLQLGVHEATASRWLEGARQGVRKRVERELRKTYGLSSSDVKHLWHWVCETDDAAFASVLRLSPTAMPRRKNVQGGMA